jgi:hypothetical protein
MTIPSPDRQLDELIATRVLKWTVVSGKLVAGPSDAGALPPSVPPFSSNDTAAEQLANQLMRGGWVIHSAIKETPDGETQHGVTLSDPYRRGRRGGQYVGNAHWFCVGLTQALASAIEDGAFD